MIIVYDLNLTFDLAIVTFTLKICPGYISETIRCKELVIGWVISRGV